MEEKWDNIMVVTIGTGRMGLLKPTGLNNLELSNLGITIGFNNYLELNHGLRYLEMRYLEIRHPIDHHICNMAMKAEEKTMETKDIALKTKMAKIYIYIYIYIRDEPRILS